MHIHILGICGTFMGSLAVLAKEKGYRVTGSDANVYPPMSTQLQELGIEIFDGYGAEQFEKYQPDCVVIGNALSRGVPAVEYVLDNCMTYMSGPEWLYREILCNHIVLCVAGTHGKTTTTSMLAHILESADLNPGFLIGGVPNNFNISARLTDSDYFVIEGDEYDTAFFDKQSKFLHYHPDVLVLNNLEFDHADIFEDLDAIKKQFSLLLRTVPGRGQVIVNDQEPDLKDVLSKGCWSKTISFGTDKADWFISDVLNDSFTVNTETSTEKIHWPMLGDHNRQNALAAMAAASQVGVSLEQSAKALSSFQGIKRRCEIRGVVNGVTVYDDFAHHPTAISKTIAGLRSKVGKKRIIAVLEFGSNTMRGGYHHETIADALTQADNVVLFAPQTLPDNLSAASKNVKRFESVPEIVSHISKIVKKGDHILVMSNKSFAGIHQQLLDSI